MAPGPGIPEPDGRQDVQLGRFRPAVLYGDSDQHVFRSRFRVLDEYIKVAAFIEHAGVDQLELALVSPALAVLFDELLIGESRLRIFVQIPHVGVRGSGIQVEVTLLAVLAVISLVAGQTEEALLEDRVAAVPQRDGEADPLVPVGNTGNAVLVPAVSLGSGVVVRDVFPGRAVLAVVFPHRAPGPLAQIRPPALPVRSSIPGFFETLLLGSGLGHRVFGSSRLRFED